MCMHIVHAYMLYVQLHIHEDFCMCMIVNRRANLRNAASTVKANRAQYQAGSETVLLGLTQFAHLVRLYVSNSEQ